MYKFSSIIWALLICSICISCGEEPKKEVIESLPDNVIVPTKTIELWNGNDFSDWFIYVPDSSVDVDSVWSIVDGVLHCSGKPSGYIRTAKDYANYKLTLQWRWVAEPGNSGVLLHMSLPDTVWPKCIEAQLMTENAGDFYVIGGTEMNEHINKNSRQIAKQKESSENPPGEWNSYEIICKNNTIKLYVNGVLQNEATKTSVTSGKIGMQSEGKPIQFKNIYLEPVK